ncbi:cystatin-S-like [Grammomys surdaster]|uniref:cystatin-S-like n=1 Tax=Grammomys surdaster TaxID=491861 RepID=UPI00109FBFF8|nr:cystatin-S-like [Grammomys surdaster]
MACQLHAQLILLTTFILVLNLRLYPVLGHNLGDTEKSSMEEEGAPEALNAAVMMYNENKSDLYLRHVVEVKNVRKHMVARKNLFFDVILGKTTCMKTQADLTNCLLNDQTDQQEHEFCSFEVLLSYMETYTVLMNSSCHRI